MTEHAVIFDCDGVLVDSEKLSARVARSMVADFGLALSEHQTLDIIRGRKVASWVAELESRAGQRFPSDFIPAFRRKCAATYDQLLQPVPGVESVIRGLAAPLCVASSAPLDKIRNNLRMTGLLHYFGNRIYSAYEIGAWKPDPHLFLHAAGQLGVAPPHCVVVEDSVVGVQAGVAADMTVLGYAPDDTAGALAAEGAIAFDSMTHLPRLLAECGVMTEQAKTVQRSSH